MSSPNLQVKYDYNNQQIKVEPKTYMSKSEMAQLGQGLFEILKRYDSDELDQLNTRLNELDQKLRDVQSIIRFLKYGGDEDQKNHSDDIDFKSASQPDSNGRS